MELAIEKETYSVELPIIDSIDKLSEDEILSIISFMDSNRSGIVYAIKWLRTKYSSPGGLKHLKTICETIYSRRDEYTNKVYIPQDAFLYG
jgi:hypothetical protein